jgi:Cu(I)/Ag(I) efflux system membrane fusion protein
MHRRYAALTIIVLAAGMAAGIALERKRAASDAQAADDGPDILYWVAPMDPNFRRNGPGKSPMGMDLVPVYEGGAPTGDPEDVVLSPVEINAIGVRTAIARIEPVARRIETVGFLRYDEHATSHVHMRVRGWIEELAVRAVGDSVAAGDLLFELYAPEITIASSELLRATRRGDRAEAQVARRKLRNFGVSPAQIEEMATAEAPAQHIRVHAPQDGVVIALEAADGMYLEPATRAMSLTDLSTIWLIVDVFERDIGRLSEDMRALARFEPLPGRVFEGAVDYIYPELDPVTRTLPVRLRFDNAEGLLRPNMYGSVTLVPPAAHEAVTVPSEAVIRTGRAERVILATGDGSFRPRLVTAGLRDSFGEGGRTEIVQGLEPGETVVASAQFLIDSESALSGSLMRFAPTEVEPARARGTLVAADPGRRAVEIAHEAVPFLDWPAMTTRFAVSATVDLARWSAGDAVAFTLVRGADGLLAVTDLGRDDGIAATGTGLVHAVTPDGRLSLSHDPIPALGWPAMEMDMPVAGLDAATVPLGVPVTFDLARDGAGLYTIVGLRAEGARVAEPAPSPAAPPITVDGRIESVDVSARRARITHGPIAEIGMPGMTMDFALAPGVNPDALPVGQDATLTFARPDGPAMLLERAEPQAQPMTVEGIVNAVDAEARMANVTHGPLTRIGMPGMTMDMPLGDGLGSDLPVGRMVDLRIVQGGDFSLTLVGVEEAR